MSPSSESRATASTRQAYFFLARFAFFAFFAVFAFFAFFAMLPS